MKYIVDTNALLRNPEVLEEYEVVIPSHVNREIEHLELTRKSDRTLQWEIRRFKRIVDETDVNFFDLKDYKFTLDNELDPNYTDNILLQVAVDNGWGMITNDRLLRMKCKQFNIPVVKHEASTFIEHKGFREKFMTEDELKIVYQNLGVNQFDLIANEYIIINDDLDGELMDIMKWTGECLVSLRDKKGKLGKGFKTDQFGAFAPRDEHQIMAVDSILHNQITALRGRAGSGKSLIALSTAWYLVEKEGYKLVIFVNPVPSLNAQELGFYKGDKLEKLLQSSVGTMLKAKFGDETGIIRAIQDNMLDILPFVDLRGFDTGDKTIAWILEAQNLTAELMKLGLQRVGEGSKVIVDGDYHQQIDKDIYVSDNGMKRMSEVFRGTEFYGEVELQNVHRSRIAELADKM
jgi:predicted ribonuclease YlaK